MAAGSLRSRAEVFQAAQQFGKAISEFQAIQWKLADMATEIDAAQPAHPARGRHERRRDEDHAGILHGEAFRQRSGGASAPTRACRFTAATASSKTIPAEKFYRDVKLCTIGEGTSEIQRLVIARQLLEE